MPNYSIDIFKILNSLDSKNLEFFNNLEEKELKDIQPYVLMKWLSGTNDELQIYLLNETINPYAFTLQKHKMLLIKLLTISTNGKNKRYKWIKQKSKEKYTNSISVIKEYFQYSTKEALEAFRILKKTDILEYAQQLGRQDEDLKKIKKELK